MDIKKTEQFFAGISENVFNRKLKAALDLLRVMVRNFPMSDHYYELENLSENYQNLLKYEFEGYRDPNREEILNSLSASILALADEIRHSVTDAGLLYIRGEKNLIAKEFGEDPAGIATHFDSILFNLEMQKMTEESGLSFDPVGSFDQIFRLIWLTDRISDDLAGRITGITHSSAVPWYDKSLVVSGLILSVLRYFDPRKITLLSGFAEVREQQVYERAMVGLVLALMVYGRRAGYYREISEAMTRLGGNQDIRDDVGLILLQLLLAQETDKITEEFEKEVLPEMRKMLPRIEDKLQLGKLYEEEDEEGRNPGWKDMIEEVPGLFERIEKFTRMQMEGGDVFMGTFRMLKGFDFFRTMSNWFVPYYPEHPQLSDPVGESPGMYARLLESLDHAFYICNSDKYSFVLNFLAIPGEQKNMIISHFEAELQQMKEMTDEEKILGMDSLSKTIFIQFIQDLYRFFKLYFYRNEFDDLFMKKLHFTSLWFYHDYFRQEKFAGKIAAFHFDNEHYEEAIEVYELLVKEKEPVAEYFEKIGYSFQKLRKYEQAVEYYRKAELFDCDRLWVSGKLGFCYMKTRNWEAARKHYREAARLKPDDLNLHVHIGQCSLNLNEYEEALEDFSKVRYYQPGNIKVLRPVAYCHFILGKLDEAAGFYKVILDSESPTSYDYMNAGHVQLCLGNRKDALVLYRKCLADDTFPPEIFAAAFDEDTPHLVNNGVNKEEIPLILDYLLFQNS